MKNERIIVSLSGGLDSATVLAWAKEKYKEVKCCGFNYGSKHNRIENKCAEKLCKYYGVKFELFNLKKIMKNFESNLLKTGGEIPVGHYEAENMKLTIVPGRNLIFSAILAGYAETLGFNAIGLGVHQGDHAIYPDCRFEFIESLLKTILLSSNGKITIKTPFIERNKIGIVQWGLEHKVPYELTRTCYTTSKKACGKCGSCVERLEAFGECGIDDKIEYEK